jgi:hypothetical protein
MRLHVGRRTLSWTRKVGAAWALGVDALDDIWRTAVSRAHTASHLVADWLSLLRRSPEPHEDCWRNWDDAPELGRVAFWQVFGTES